MTNGPFTDEMIRHALTTVQTQHGIIKYAEAMAQVLAEAGRASHKATGDRPSVAINRWCEVIRKRAHELIREDAPTGMRKKMLERWPCKNEGNSEVAADGSCLRCGVEQGEACRMKK